jgi:hypothetical protein
METRRFLAAVSSMPLDTRRAGGGQRVGAMCAEPRTEVCANRAAAVITPPTSA